MSAPSETAPSNNTFKLTSAGVGMGTGVPMPPSRHSQLNVVFCGSHCMDRAGRDGRPGSQRQRHQ
jgi:hypothetical protein